MRKLSLLAERTGADGYDRVGKLRRIIEKNGHKYSNKIVTKAREGGSAATTTPKKTAATQTIRKRVTPMAKPKKRKLDHASDDEDVEDKEITEEVEYSMLGA